MRKMKKFVLNTAVLTASSIILRTLFISFNAYVAKTIGPEGMGVFQLMMSVYALFITIAGSGASFAATRLVAEEMAADNHSSMKAALRRCLIYALFFGTLSMCLVWTATDFITSIILHGKIDPITIKILGISLPFMACTSVFKGYFIAMRKVVKTSLEQIFEQITKITITIYLLTKLAPLGLNYACLALILGGVVGEIVSFTVNITLYAFDKGKYNKKTPIRGGLTRRMLGIAMPVALSSYIRSSLGTFQQLMVPKGLEKSGNDCATALAQYGIIQGMVMPILMFPAVLLSSFSQLLMPEIAEQNALGNVTRINYIIERIFRVTLIFSVGVCGILLAFARDLSLTIYGNEQAGAFLTLLAPCVLAMYFDGIVDAILKGLNQQVGVVWINIIDTIACIAMLAVLLPSFGVMGYIAVIFLSEALNTTLSVGRLSRVTHFQIDFLMWVIIPLITIGFCVCLGKILFATMASGIIFSVALYLGILYVLGILKLDV